MEQEVWYAVWTRSRHEYKVEELLKRKGFTTFLPTSKVPSLRRDRRKILDCPLFPGYLFLYLAYDRYAHLSILQTPGVVRILGEDRKVPTPVPTVQVESVEKVLSSGLVFASVPYLRVGERVRIKSGPLFGAEGVVQRVQPGKTRLVISVDLLQRSVAVELEGWLLERA
jgi:transcription antitermination factor NusG